MTKIVAVLGAPRLAPPVGGPRLRTMVSVPSTRASAAAVMSMFWTFTPALKVSVPDSGV
jgi:hypothetical protein